MPKPAAGYRRSETIGKAKEERGLGRGGCIWSVEVCYLVANVPLARVFKGRTNLSSQGSLEEGVEERKKTIIAKGKGKRVCRLVLDPKRT